MKPPKTIPYERVVVLVSGDARIGCHRQCVK